MKRAKLRRNEYPRTRKGGAVAVSEAKPHKTKSKVVVPRAPSWLPDDARRHFKVLAKDLTTGGTLRMSDAPALASYCKACFDLQEAERKIQETGGEVITGPNNGLVWNMWATVRNDARSAMLKFGEQFGLTPKSRLKVKAPPRDPSTKDALDDGQLGFDNLIDGGREFVRKQPWRQPDGEGDKAG